MLDNPIFSRLWCDTILKNGEIPGERSIDRAKEFSTPTILALISELNRGPVSVCGNQCDNFVVIHG